ncbi:MAG: DNA polymerase/3'-5' exonuclease PolX [Phycisphaerales bacterium]
MPGTGITNEQAAARLEEVARLMDLLGEDGFKVNAHARAARAIEGLTGSIAELAKDRKALLEVPGIGPKIADKIIELCSTGGITEHQELLAKVPAGLLQVMQVPGLGPKTVRSMWQSLGITDTASLKKAIDDGSLLTLPRMGEKAVEKIKASLALAEQGNQRLHLGRAWPIAQHLAAHLRAVPGVAHAEPAGSLRRGRETVGDIDIVVSMKKGSEHAAPAVMEAFRTAPGVKEVIVSGETKTSTRVAVGDAERTIQADVRVVPAQSFGSALQYFTGSKEHNVRLRALAQSKGLTLNEWGLFQDEQWRAYHQSTQSKAKGHKPLPMPAPVAGATEESIYTALGVPPAPPEAREDRGEFDRTAPLNPVDTADIRAELHAHTTASDGLLTIEQLVRAAHARGFHTIAVTDHSQSSTIARGLKPDRMREHIKAVRAVGQSLGKELGIRVLTGSEVDILADGSLDYKDELLAQLDIVVASPHASLSQDPATATKRLLKAIAHPHVNILGHPTGRLILQRKGLEPDMDEITSAAREHDVALEINAHWMRLDLRDTHTRTAVDKGCLIAINCDVHAPDDFDNLRYGVTTARRGWVTREACINTWPAARLHAWLAR